MKRSEINLLISEATDFFAKNGWALPPAPKWDVTDFGLGEWSTFGLVLVNLAEEPEYCEKLMYARRGMKTPMHFHKMKKEDIICRAGVLAIELAGPSDDSTTEEIRVKLNGIELTLPNPARIELHPGERVTLFSGIRHEFAPVSEQCIIGEVSTANDDVTDNYFDRDDIGRFPGIEEDEAPIARLVSER